MNRKRVKQLTAGSSSGVLQEGPEYLCSAARYRDLPGPVSAEYCIVGRSNVGKSSFINHVCERSRLAHVSKTPGKTDLANFYRIDDSMVWVDLPGYGYAKVSRSEKIRWSRLIRDYCEKRQNCYGVIWLIDIRHIGLKADVEAFAWFQTLRLPVFPVITKSDKLSQSIREKHVREIKKVFQCECTPVVYSIHKHVSRRQFWERFSIWREAVALNRS